MTCATVAAMEDRFQWGLPDLLKREGITPYRLLKTLEDKSVSQTTVYRWSREMPERLDMPLFGNVIQALREISGREITANDLLIYKEVA